MKRTATALLLLFLAAFALSAQEIRDIDETVVIRADGSATVTQVWNVSVVSGTEFYLPFDNLGPMDITDLSVIENGVAFESDGDRWDTDRSLEQKRGRCGIVRKSGGGVELCWGQGDYGDHVWTVSCTVRGLVMRMGDYNGLYFSFVNPGLAAPPRHVRVRILNGTGGELWTPENVRVWGFRSESEIYVEDGAIRAESLSPFGRSSAMTVLVRFDPDLLEPAVSYHKDFDDVQKMALEGSEYKKKTTFWDVLKTIALGFVVLLFSPVGWILIGSLYLFYLLFTYYVLGHKYEKGIFGKRRIEGWYRDVPLQGSIPAAYYALSKGDRIAGAGLGKDLSNNLIGAYFLKWVLNGSVNVVPDPARKNRVNLSFENPARFEEPVENDLYQMVREASGDNLILEAGEFEKWSKKSFKRVSNLPEREKTRGLQWFQDHHYLVKDGKCNAAGQEQAIHLVEFRNFLQDFTLSNEREAGEVALWRDYLVFAALFGIADKVAKQFEKLYPAEFSQLSQTAGLSGANFYDLMRVSREISASAMRNAQAEKLARSGGSGGGKGWSSGGGGHFSMGGGGGSFGGSFGGGSR